MTDKPALSFGQASFIVNEAVRIVEEAGLHLKNYVSYKTDNDFYNRLRGDDSASLEYSIEDGSQLSLMDDFFNLFSDDDPVSQKIKPMEVLSLKIEDIRNAVRRMRFDGVLTDTAQAALTTIRFFELADNRFTIQEPSPLQYAYDMFDRDGGRNRITEASAIRAMTHDLNNL